MSFSTSRYPDATFGQFIRKARLEKGLRQKDLAEAVGVDEFTVVNWERYEKLPTKRCDRVKAACEILRLDCAGVVDRFGPSPSDEPGFGPTLRNARIKKGLTQEQAARLARIDPGTLARWEKADREPPRGTQKKLARLQEVLGLSSHAAHSDSRVRSLKARNGLR